MSPERRTITARATVNLAGLRAGQTATVDPDDTRTRALLTKGLLVTDDPWEHTPPPKPARVSRPTARPDAPATAEPATRPYQPPTPE